MRPGRHAAEQRQGAVHVPRRGVPGEQRVVGDDVAVRHLVERPARVLQGAALAVHGHERGADEQVASEGGLEGLRVEGPAEAMLGPGGGGGGLEEDGEEVRWAR